MFSGIPQKNRAAAETYFDEHLSHNDYYTQNETERGQWIGLGAGQLGLKQGEIVNREAFLKLCDNQHPQTGEQLTPQNFKNRRIFFDFVCSPPKSVSILAVTMNDQRIVQAHKEASSSALRELETFAAARIRKNGIQGLDRTTGNVVGAAFMHTTSRALDPQLHTHFVLFNSTWDNKERRWKALQTGDMFGAINYATEVYRNELVKRLHQIGYQTRKATNGFEIEGVEQKFIERFSKRSQQRDMAVKRRESELGRKLSKKEVAHIIHQSRPKKLKGASDEQVRKQQLGEIGFFEKHSLRNVTRATNGVPKPFVEQIATDEAVSHGIGHVFERNSVVPQHKILEAALVRGRGCLDLAELKRELANRNELVQVDAEFSTREILEKELSLIRAVNAGINDAKPFAQNYEASERLGTDQRKTLAHVMNSTDRFTGFRGLAGSGKSTALSELSQALVRQGYEPVFCAPTASAVDTLRKDGIKAMTLAKLLLDSWTLRGLSRRSVIILDEAGAVGLNDMAALFKIVRDARCRVVFSGDTGQHQSVARGDALRIIEQYSGYKFSELTTIRRQKPEEFRKVVELAAARQTDKAFAKLVELGAITESLTDHDELYRRAVAAYLSATKQGKSALLISPTWNEIEAVTEKVRDTLKAQGELGQQEEAVTVFDSLSWTEAQRKDVSQYEPGQRLRFIRRTKHFDRDETVEVRVVLESGLRVRRADGTEVDFIPASVAPSFDAGEARELKVAAGDWLLLQANRSKEFINGERVQVREIRNGHIALMDGRVLPADYNTFTHGYAVTSHSSQGKTVDEVLLVASSKSLAAVNREQFYVSISRGRERVHVFTDDAELLAHRVTDTHERKAAIELQDLRDGLAKLGFTRHGRETESELPVKRRDARPVRPIRKPVRAIRPTRLAPSQRLAQIIELIVRRLNEVFGMESTPSACVAHTRANHDVAEQAETRAIKQTEVKRPENIKPAPTISEEKTQAIRHSELVRERLRQRLAKRRGQNQNPPRQGHSRGIGM